MIEAYAGFIVKRVVANVEVTYGASWDISHVLEGCTKIFELCFKAFFLICLNFLEVGKRDLTKPGKGFLSLFFTW